MAIPANTEVQSNAAHSHGYYQLGGCGFFWLIFVPTFSYKLIFLKIINLVNNNTK